MPKNIGALFDCCAEAGVGSRARGKSAESELAHACAEHELVTCACAENELVTCACAENEFVRVSSDFLAYSNM